MSKGAEILLIEDDQKVLDSLGAQLAMLLPDTLVATWQPSAGPTNDEGEADPRSEFEQHLTESIVVVATDHDLTKQGYKGLFGSAVVEWCQEHVVPVGDFSRGNARGLPNEPALFELRVPPDDIHGAQFIAAAYCGFRDLKSKVTEVLASEKRDQGLASLLSECLERPQLESQLALYLSRFGNAALGVAGRLRDASKGDRTAGPPDFAPALSYIMGHALLNVVLRYPGPILSLDALCAYTGTGSTEAGPLHELFGEARYDGPFSGLGQFYWRSDVDSMIDAFGPETADDVSDDFAAINRAAVEEKLGRQLAAHSCDRDDCGGKRGGFLCPFTKRTVCARRDCSVATSNWIPTGASLSRVEKDYHDEWAPLLRA
jgi:hypothetical protein